jgi:hypothetical protein
VLSECECVVCVCEVVGGGEEEGRGKEVRVCMGAWKVDMGGIVFY